MESTQSFEILAESCQFYLGDEHCQILDATINWDDQSMSRMLGVGNGMITVRTARSMTVPVRISVAEREPVIDLRSWDKINECSLTIASGKVAMMGYIDYYAYETKLKVKPGVYRIRVHYGNLHTFTATGLKEDHYEIVMWPEEEERPVQELK